MDIGDRAQFDFEFRDINGILTDPTTVAGWIRDPQSVVIPLTISRVDVGLYETTYDIVKGGEHWVRVETTGTIKSAIEKRFNVVERRVPAA